MGLGRVGIFREKELGNMDKVNLSGGETLRDASCVCVMHGCYFRRKLICLSPKAHDSAPEPCQPPSELGEFYSVPNTADVPVLSAKRVGQPKTHL